MNNIANPKIIPFQTVTTARVASVASSPDHTFSKTVQPQIQLLYGLGVDGDAHKGVKVRHRSRVAQNPNQPNLRQVSFLHEEVFDELSAQGFDLRPGDIGENILTRGIDLLNLPVGTRLRIGPEATVELTGLRNPCAQIEAFRPGLLKALLGKAEDGTLIRKAGVMGIVVLGGTVKPGDAVHIDLPPAPHRKMDRV